MGLFTASPSTSRAQAFTLRPHLGQLIVVQAELAQPCKVFSPKHIAHIADAQATQVQVLQGLKAGAPCALGQEVQHEVASVLGAAGGLLCGLHRLAVEHLQGGRGVWADLNLEGMLIAALQPLWIGC